MLHALIFLRTEPAMGKKSKSKLPKKDRSGFAGICPTFKAMRFLVSSLWEISERSDGKNYRMKWEIQSTRSIILTTMLDGPVYRY